MPYKILSKKGANYKDTFIDIDGMEVPLRIYYEHRFSVRVSLGKDNVILRVPKLSFSSLENHLNLTKDWLKHLSLKKPEILSKYHISKYEYKNSLTVLGKYQFDFTLNETERSNGTISIHGQNLAIEIPKNLDQFDKQKMVRTLLSRMMAKKFKPKVIEKIEHWNQYFGKSINGVFLKYNSTNWGSCSVNGNINISTRSLLLPEEVFDYILVHELSHLVEMNHSHRFWAVVKKVMPDYEQKEAWIKKHGSKLDF